MKRARYDKKSVVEYFLFDFVTQLKPIVLFGLIIICYICILFLTELNDFNLLLIYSYRHFSLLIYQTYRLVSIDT